MSEDMVIQSDGALRDSRSDSSILRSLANILNTLKNDLDDLVLLYATERGCFRDDESWLHAFQQDLKDVWSEAVSAIEHLYIRYANYVQLRELFTMMSRGRCFSHNGRYSGRNNRRPRNATATEPIRNPTSNQSSDYDDDSSDFETISSSATYTVYSDEEESDDEDSCSETDNDTDYYYSYLSMSDLASDGASIRSEESTSDDEELSDDEYLEDEHDDWSKPVRLASTCHILTENVVRELVRREYVPQWFDVVDLVLESDEQVSKGPAKSDRVGDRRAVEDPGKNFKKLINKELLRDEQARMISLVETAPESTRLEITATTLFTPSNHDICNGDITEID